MRSIRAIFRTTFFIIFGLLLLYVMPQHDVVRVSSTEIIRTDFTTFNRWFYAQADSGAAEMSTRDLRLINTQKKKSYLLNFIRTDAEEVMVYRNEDTGWIWPPYFKFDSSDLQAEANDLESTSATPRWVIVTHYGWRNRFFSIYPNAIALEPTDTPNPRIIPWFTIFFFVFLIVAYLFVRAIWRQFRERTIDPMVDRTGSKVDEMSANASRTKKKWFGKSK